MGAINRKNDAGALDLEFELFQNILLEGPKLM